MILMVTGTKNGGGPEPSPAQSSPWVTAGLLIVLGIAIAAATIFYVYSQHQLQAEIQQRQALNIELGLPRDYPLNLVPVFAGARIIEAERDSAESTDGEPMDKWYVHAELDEDKQQVYDFYHEHLLGHDLRQTQYVGIPTGYGADYADERHIVELIIETRADEQLLQLEISIYRVR